MPQILALACRVEHILQPLDPMHCRTVVSLRRVDPRACSLPPCTRHAVLHMRRVPGRYCRCSLGCLLLCALALPFGFAEWQFPIAMYPLPVEFFRLCIGIAGLHEHGELRLYTRV